MNSDWNTTANWTPESVPNGPADTATFAVSNTTNIAIGPSVGAILDGIVFDPGASAYTISLTGVSGILFIEGVGIANNSGIPQKFVCSPDASDLNFIIFNNNSNAGDATVFINNSGAVSFQTNSSATSSMFINNGADVDGHPGGLVSWYSTGSAGNSTFINNGSGVFGGATQWYAGSPGTSTFINNGALVAPGDGGATQFLVSPGTATLIANGGSNGGDGGTIFLFNGANGGNPRVELFGNGDLDLRYYTDDAVTIGSVEGDGIVDMGPAKLIVGGNDLSTTFAGVIQDAGDGGGFGGSLSKIGAGTLTLSGANTYTGGTTVSEGVLLANSRQDSATGTGDVTVSGGVLGGDGMIGGRVSVDAGGFLSPGRDGPGTLRIKSALRFNSNGTYLCELQTAMGRADAVSARNVRIKTGALASIGDTDTSVVPPGTVFTIINNTGANPISGTFSNLADGAIFTIGSNAYQASYEGGTGNDLTLTVVP